MKTGTVLAIERCSLHDGPGLRTTVFLKGCPLTCVWCHNPESQSFKPELFFYYEKCVGCGLCGTTCTNHSISTPKHYINRKNCIACGKCVSACLQSALEIKGVTMWAQDVINIALKDMRYYKQSGGGLTLSGGEPLAQFEFTLSILRLAKESGLHTCLETCGYTPKDKILSVIPYVDLLLYDFKESNDNKHKKFIGVSRDLIMDNLLAIDKAGAKIILRCPIIPKFNDRDSHFSAIAATVNALNNVIEINIMPYHPMGASKAVRMGKEYPLSDVCFPLESQIDSWLTKVKQETHVTVKKG